MPEEFFKEHEQEFTDLFYEQTAEEQSDDFLNKMQTTCPLLEEYAKQKDERIKELEALKDESRIQLEYLNEKFGETGTTNALLSRLK